MPIIYEDALKKELSQKKLAPVYLIFGDDAYLKKTLSARILSMVCDSDDIFNCHRFEDGSTLQDVYDAVFQLPMMSEKKCVTLTDYNFEKASKSDFDKLCALASSGIDTTVLIILFNNIEVDYKKSAKSKKLIAAAEKGGGRAVLLNHRRPAELARMLTDGATKRGVKLDNGTAAYMVECVGQDIETLQNELEKLCAACNGGTAGKAEVDGICVKSTEANVYNITKAILARNAGEAMSILDGLFFQRLEPMIIFSTISGFYVDLYRAYTARTAGVSAASAVADFGYRGKEFVLDRAFSALRNIDKKQLRLSLCALLECDRALKSFSGDPRIPLEQLIVRLIYIIAKGEAVDSYQTGGNC